MWRNIIREGGEISLGKVEKYHKKRWRNIIRKDGEEKLKEDACSDQIVIFPLCDSRNTTRTPMSQMKFVKLIKLHLY